MPRFCIMMCRARDILTVTVVVPLGLVKVRRGWLEDAVGEDESSCL